MTSLALGVLLACTSHMPLHAENPNCDDASKKVIAKAIIAHGGKTAMLNFDSATILVKSAGTANLGGLTVPMTSEYLSKDPQHRKQVVVVNFFLFSVRTVKVTNGREIWVKSDNHPAMLLTGADVDVERKLDYYAKIGTLYPLLEDPIYELCDIGTAKIDGQAATGILVKSKGMPEVRLFFSTSTGLLIKQVEEGSRKKERIRELYYGKYKCLERVMVATERKTFIMGQQVFNLSVSSLEIIKAKDVRDSDFCKPE